MTGKTFNLDDIHDGDLEAVVQRLTNEDIARLQAHRDEFVTLPCAACESTDLAPAYEANGFEYERCRGCGLMMLSPAPNAERQRWQANRPRRRQHFPR